MRRILLYSIYIFAFFYAADGYSSDISISPSQVMLSNDQSVTVDVISNNTQLVYAILLKLNYDPTKISIGDISLGSDTAACDLSTYSTSGQTMISVFCPTAIAIGSMQIARVGFTAKDNGQNWASGLTLTAQYDEIQQPSVQNYTEFFNNNYTPPVMNAISDKQGTTFTFNVSAVNANGRALTYWASNLPAGAMFDPSMQVFNWQPDISQTGVYNITFSVSDGISSDSTTAQITVIPTYTIPVSTPVHSPVHFTGGPPPGHSLIPLLIQHPSVVFTQAPMLVNTGGTAMDGSINLPTGNYVLSLMTDGDDGTVNDD